MATRKRNKAAKKPNTAAKKPDTANKKPDTAPKKPDTAPKKPETAALELAKQLYGLLQGMLSSPVALSTSEAVEFQRTFNGLISSASQITKLPYTTNGNGNGNGTPASYSSDVNVQYLEYKNSRLKDLIIDILMKK